MVGDGHLGALVLGDGDRGRGVGGGHRVALTGGRGRVLAQGAGGPGGQGRAGDGAAISGDLELAGGRVGVVTGVGDLHRLALGRGVVAADRLGDREGPGQGRVGVGDVHELVPALDDGHRVLGQGRVQLVAVPGGRIEVLRQGAGGPGGDESREGPGAVAADLEAALQPIIAGVGEGVGGRGGVRRTALDRLDDREGALVGEVGVGEGGGGHLLAIAGGLDGDGLLPGGGQGVALDLGAGGVLGERAGGALGEGLVRLNGGAVALGDHGAALAVGAGVGEGVVLGRSAVRLGGAGDGLGDLEGARRHRCGGLGGVVEGDPDRGPITDGQGVGGHAAHGEGRHAPGVAVGGRGGLGDVLGQGQDRALGEGAGEGVGLADAGVELNRPAHAVGVECAGGRPVRIGGGRGRQGVVNAHRQGGARDIDGVQGRAAQGLEHLEAAEARSHIHVHLE